MRRSILNKLAASTVLVTAIIFSSSQVFAQRRSHQDEKDHHDKKGYSKRSKENKYHKHDKHNKKRDYHYKSHRKNGHDHHKGHSKVKSRHYHGDRYHADRVDRRHDAYRHNRNVHRSHRHHKHVHHTYRHAKHLSHHYYKRHGHRCYAHPRFGNVVVRFAVAPIVIRHHEGDYYYTNGFYYQFYPEIGYVRVDMPESVCFDDISDDCERVSYRGGVYFRVGDLYFEKDHRGFHLSGSLDL